MKGPELRDMQDSWFSKNADEIQGYADSHDTKHFHDVLKAVYRPQSSGSHPLNADGTQLLTEKKQILEGWAEHFINVLNRPANISDEAIARLPQEEISEDLDTFPTENEVGNVVKQHSCGKAPGSNAIPADVYKAGSPAMMQKLTLFQFIIVHIYKRKGYRQSCDNNPYISLLSIAGKILAPVLLNSFSISSKVSSQKASAVSVLNVGLRT
ncbi:uncharacterized protein LOC143282884 [Babylonia areolata]|uniref:uncharacterized protein LOC143282884 n=1 Tax=Babylonia areolata TaxID=304850 RepID=UPI003FD4A042